MPDSANSHGMGAWIRRLLARPGWLAVWCVLSAFGTYACMYGFRKPFTAATFDGTGWGDALKVWYVTAQVLGYTLSKFIGIKVVSEMPAERRAKALIGLILGAHSALLAFALTPAPDSRLWLVVKSTCLFANGLPLGMVFGLVLGFLEGRRMTELFVAGLCTSFILASGFTKTVGAFLLETGVADHWMPFTAGLVFLLPLIVFVSMLARIPPPDETDIVVRSERSTMTGAERWAMFRRHGWSLGAILLAYLLITVLRGVRDDFAPEIWGALGHAVDSTVFARSEFVVGMVVLLVSALVVLFRDNRRGFFCSLWMSAGGLALALCSVAAWQGQLLNPFAFMVVLGIGMYIPYVAVHTSLFERLIAMTREKGNIGYLMYLADSCGYLGVCLLMFGKTALSPGDDFLAFFMPLCWSLLAATLVLFAIAILIYRRRFPRESIRKPEPVSS